MGMLYVVSLLVLTHFGLCHGVGLVVDPKRMTIAVGENGTFTMQLSIQLYEPTVIHLYEDSTTASVQHEVSFPAKTMNPRRVPVKGEKAGFCNVTMNSTVSWLWDLSDAFVEVCVVRSHALSIIAILFGWIYAVLWSIPFYHQFILNFRRKSAGGMNSDILAYNLTGFLVYALFNSFVYWSEPIKTTYKVISPHGVQPVLLNDVVFSLHGIFITLVLGVQYVLYETAQLRVSSLCRFFHSVALFVSLVILLIAGTPWSNQITWLGYLYCLSYIKLAFTIIIYLSEIYLKYNGESVDSWCIPTFLLDFTGGAFSLLQVVLLYYNNDDWTVFVGNPAKLSLGSTAMSFSIVFIVLHCVVYRQLNLPTTDTLVLVDEEHLEGNRSVDPLSPSLRESREALDRGAPQGSDDTPTGPLHEGCISENATLA